MFFAALWSRRAGCRSGHCHVRVVKLGGEQYPHAGTSWTTGTTGRCVTRRPFCGLVPGHGPSAPPAVRVALASVRCGPCFSRRGLRGRSRRGRARRVLALWGSRCGRATFRWARATFALALARFADPSAAAAPLVAGQVPGLRSRCRGPGIRCPSLCREVLDAQVHPRDPAGGGNGSGSSVSTANETYQRPHESGTPSPSSGRSGRVHVGPGPGEASGVSIFARAGGRCGTGTRTGVLRGLPAIPS